MIFRKAITNLASAYEVPYFSDPKFIEIPIPHSDLIYYAQRYGGLEVVDQDWNSIKCRLRIGDSVLVRIFDRKPFGLLVIIDGPATGVIERIGMVNDGYALDEFDVGSTTLAIVIGFRDWSKQVELKLPEKILQNE